MSRRPPNGWPTRDPVRLPRRLLARQSLPGRVLLRRQLIRRARGGEWKGDDTDPAAEVSVGLHLPHGTICWPTQRVMKRFKQGPEDSIFAYVARPGSRYRAPAGAIGAPDSEALVEILVRQPG